MSNLAIKQAIYQDIVDLRHNVVGEIIDGQLEIQPRPTPKDAVVSSSLGAQLISPFQKGKGDPGGWWIIDEPECYLSVHILVADLAGWRKQRMPVFPETDWFDGVPDWVCEILSPSNARLDRIVKTLLYAQLGVVNLWLIDSNLQTLEAFQLHDSHWLLIGYFANDQAVSIVPFAEHTFLLSDLWG